MIRRKLWKKTYRVYVQGSIQYLEKKLVLQFLGSIGTPIALLVGWQVLKDSQVLSLLCLLGAVATFLMQLGAFVAVWFGVRKLGPFLLSNLTTPASLAKELREG